MYFVGSELSCDIPTFVPEQDIAVVINKETYYSFHVINGLFFD
jgi:hypothetical protein